MHFEGILAETFKRDATVTGTKNSGKVNSHKSLTGKDQSKMITEEKPLMTVCVCVPMRRHLSV